MSFNVDEWRKAHPPGLVTVTIDGQPWTAKPVGVGAVARFHVSRQARTQIGRDYGMRRFLRTAFPFKWRHMWKPLADPVSVVMKLTAGERGRILAALIAHAEGLVKLPAEQAQQLSEVING